VKDLQTLEENYASIGLITEISNNPRFIHNSFAASYFAKNFKTTGHILEEFIFEEKFTNVRFFFDLLLSNKSSAHVAVLYKDVALLETLNVDVVKKKDSAGRSALHLACSWDHRCPPLSIQKHDD